MRIAVLAPLVTPVAEPQIGGSQALLADLARGLAERGHDVRVYAATGSRIEGVDVVDTGVRPETLRATLFRADGGEGAPGEAVEAARAAFERAGSMIADDRPEVVHAHAFDAPAVDVAAGLGLPVVQVLHLPPDQSVADAVRTAVAAGGPFRVVTVSQAMRAAWAGAGVDAGVIRPGVPVDRVPWRAEPGSGALFAGRLSPEKGAPDAIAIAAEAGLPLTIVGPPYDEPHAREVAGLAAASGATMTGPVERERLWALMAASAVVLCPIRWDEPFGLVAAETQCAGTPVVGYRRGALPEVVLEGRTGVLVDEGNRAAAAAAVGTALAFDRGAIRRHAEDDLALRPAVDAFEARSIELAPSAGRGVR
ncbi:MAG TPA: glycosyltransferase [Actinomycetota bacterium]|nr:glycosyltransferase [Actinomycetota bacterium]